MKPKTEELLYLLLWAADRLANPTFRNLTDSYEAWAYRKGLLRQLNTLEKQQMLERDSAEPDERIYRLTEQGRLHALGGRDPQERWSRSWDGLWRLVVFDVPTSQNAWRDKLRYYLRDRFFGSLQRSVWITPDRTEVERGILAGAEVNPSSLILLEARSCAGESDQEIVAGAWDFGGINRNYEECLAVLDQRPDCLPESDASAKDLLTWATNERNAWLKAISSDPLLPERLLPSGYLGRRVWRRRLEVLREAGLQAQGFRQ